VGSGRRQPLSGRIRYKWQRSADQSDNAVGNQQVNQYRRAPLASWRLALPTGQVTEFVAVTSQYSAMRDVRKGSSCLGRYPDWARADPAIVVAIHRFVR